MVNRGTVVQASKEIEKKRFQEYFNSVKFIKWDDITQPIIRFSDDHSIAYAIVQKRVIVETKDSFEKRRTDTTNFAWVSIYRRQAQGWELESNISTNN